jgi:hypothetical protein
MGEDDGRGGRRVVPRRPNRSLLQPRDRFVDRQRRSPLRERVDVCEPGAVVEQRLDRERPPRERARSRVAADAVAEAELAGVAELEDGDVIEDLGREHEPELRCLPVLQAPLSIGVPVATREEKTFVARDEDGA